MKKELLLIFFFVVISIYVISVFGEVSVSTSREFNVTPNTIFLNLTNTPISFRENITISANNSNSVPIDILVDDSSRLSENYTQGGSTPCQKDFVIVAQNTSGGNNTVYSLSPGSSTNFTLIFNVSSILGSCKPGRYYTNNFVIRNLTNSTENLTIAITVDLPIGSNNSQNINLPYTGIASFNGRLPPNSATYHSYYFNTSEVTNATSVYVNISWTNSSQDVDLFLFDNSGILLAKSISKNGTNEALFYNFLPSSPTVYEIKLYGNSSSPITYNGNVIFSTLDSTNRTLNFEIRNVSTRTNQTFALNNTGNITLSNVTESIDLYHVTRFPRDNGTKNFTFLVPDINVTSKLKVSLNWTGAGNYSLYLYNSSGALIANSINKHLYANVSNAMQEEYVEVTNITKGVWRVEVKNSAPASDYTLTVYQHVASPSDWINTTYNNITFNRTSLQNYIHNTTVNLNLTIPNKSMDGIYEGYVRYTSSANQLINLPITINITTPMLVVNDTIESTTFTLTENYRFNLNRTITFQVNNTGFYDVAVTIINSSNLICNVALTSGCSGHAANFTHNSFTSIGKYNYQNLTVNVTINSSLPKGVYDGWIFINATNETENLSSHPYRTFNLTFRLNLTDALIVRTISATSADGDNMINLSSVPENVTVKTTVSYINGTDVHDLYLNWTDPTDLTKNFTGVWLFEPNVSYRYPISGSLRIYNETEPIYYCDGTFQCYGINATIPNDTSGMPGGIYAVYVNVSHKRDSFNYSGYGNGAYITVNNTGLFMSTNASGCSFGSSCNSNTIMLNPGNTTVIYVNVSNFGPLTSVGESVNNITFSRGTCTGYTISSPTYVNCPDRSFAPAGNSFTCIVYWTITATTDTGGVSACQGNVIGNGWWFNPRGVNITIGVNPITTAETPTALADLEFTKAESLVLVQQNSSNYTDVQIQNTGNETLNVTFKIEGINSTWYSLNDTNKLLIANQKAGFRVTFTVGSEEIKDYAGKYNASSTDKTITKDFTLRVTPSPAKQLEINDTLALYKLEMIKLEEEINQSKEKKINVTLAEQKLAELKSKITEAENYIKTGDYFSAYQLLDKIKTLIDDTKSELAKAKEIVSKEKRKRIWIYVGIGVGLVAAAVVAYLFWPVKGYHPKKGFTFRGEE